MTDYETNHLGGENMEQDENFYLKHHGVKGMKWGVRKQRTGSISTKSRNQESARLNSKDRVIAKGTEIQNVSRGQYKDRGERLYTSYTDYDKSEYISLMAGIMYDERGYVNTFTAKKDIKVPSDQKLVDEFTKLVKDNPKQVAKDLSAAVKATSLFSMASEKKYAKVMDEVANGDLDKAKKYTDKLVVSMASKKIGKTGSNFQANLVSNGYDAVSDLNDRRGMSKTQDPLIMLDAKTSLGKPVSVKLTKKEIGEYMDLSIGKNEGGSLRERKQKRNDLSDVQHEDDNFYLQHFGVKGMKWGVKKAKDSVSGARQERAAAKKAPASSDHDTATTARKKASQGGVSKLSNKELQDAITRMNLESQYKSLVAKDPTPQQAALNYGKKIALSVAQDMAKTTAKNVIANNVKDPRVAELIKKTL